METGIDITSIERIRRLARERAFSRKVFTASEQSSAAGKKDPARCLSGCFAAKEAFMKALGTGWTTGVSWHEIKVTKTNGRDELILSGTAKELAKGRRTHLSIAYSEKLAIATVIIE